MHLTIESKLIPIYASKILEQAVVYAHSSYFYFGGVGAESVIARLDGSTYKWNNVGKLNEGRRGHNAVYLSGNFLVVGGHGTKQTEKCKYKNNQMLCQSQSPSLAHYSITPELMAVYDDYCD